jgi:hypothetical protein
MLAMQAKPVDAAQLDAGTADAQSDQQPQHQLEPHRQSSQPAAAVAAAAAHAMGQPAAGGSTSGAAAAKPLVLLLDVHLDAPVLLLPLDSASDDRIEVDLGTLQLSNRVLWEMRTEQDSQKLLVDELQVGGTIRCAAGNVRVDTHIGANALLHCYRCKGRLVHDVAAWNGTYR